MQRLISAKPVLAAAVALVAFVGASAAHASDVAGQGGLHMVPLALRVQTAHVQQPVHVQPQPVVVQPAPAHVRPQPVYVQPAPVRTYPQVARNGAWGDADRDGIPNRYDRDSRFHERHADNRGPWGDADRDGVPNRYDRAPNNPYRR